MQFIPAAALAKAGQTVVIADDLSGAAECASEFAQPGGSTCLRLVQGGGTGPGLRDPAVVVWDLDARDTSPVLSAQVLATLASSRRAYVKIDSLLRGNWAALVAAVVRAAPRPTLLCPALPRLGRGLRDGFIDLAPGQALAHATTSALEGLRQAGVPAGHHVLATGSEADLREGLLHAMAQHRLTVVDARTDAELEAMARVLESLPTPYTAIGSAGLAGALARQAGLAARACSLGAMGRMAVLVGSRTGPARAQLAQLAQASGEPVRWWCPQVGLEPAPARAARETGAAREAAAPSLHLFATRPDESANPGGRDLTRLFVQAALANLPPVDCLVATGGETARALCDALGLDHLDVLGALEPGVSLARMPLFGGVRHLVLKSGSFGDPATLVRIARMGGVLQALTTERHS